MAHAFRPALHGSHGAPARVHLKGWVFTVASGAQTFSDMGNDMRLRSRGDEVDSPEYDIEVSSNAGVVTSTFSKT